MTPDAGSATLTSELVATALRGYEQARDEPAARRALFDHLACLSAGRRVVPEVFGDAGAAVALDRDDLHWPSMTHPGAIVWTVVLATGVQGPARWRAAHAGYEVTARLGAALGAGHRRFWHATTTAGTVGGAVAAAVALDADPVAAAGHGISVAGGSIVALLERSATRMVHRDHAAATALRCARMATVPASRAGLEHPRGMLAGMGGGDGGALLAPAATSAIAATSFRRHAATGFAQAAVEAAAEVAASGPPPARDETVFVEVPAAALALADDAAPADAESAWWSVQHAVAVTLLGLDLEDPAMLGDPAVASLRTRMALSEGSASAVALAGRRAVREHAAPLTDGDLRAKWVVLNHDDPPPEGLLP